MLSPDRVDGLLSAIRGGSDLDTACHYAGLSTAAVGRVLEQGMVASQMAAEGLELTAEQVEALDVWEAMAKARADAVVRNVTLIQKAAQDGSWQAAAWWLERSAPAAYGRKNAASSVDAAQQPRQITGD